MTTAPNTDPAKVQWNRVGLFLGLTFGFTYLLDLALKLQGGLHATYYGEYLQLQMSLPAFFAILLGMFVFTDSPFRVGRPMPDGRADRARGFFFLYMILTIAFVALAVLLALSHGHRTILGVLNEVIVVAGVLGLLVFRIAKGRDSFTRAGLRGARFRDWAIYGGGVVLFLAVQAVLNIALRLGTTPNLHRLMPPGMRLPIPLFMAGIGVQSIVVGSLLGLVVAFGEERGWRGFLQGQLIRLGKKRGVLIVGLIWGAWHYPIIWMGYNYPGYPVVGTVMMTVLTVLLAYVFGYALLKTGSIWIAAFMHAAFDQTAAFIVTVVNKPANPIFSFGIGLYGLAMLAVIVLLLLRDPIWRDAPVSPLPGSTGTVQAGQHRCRT